MTDLTLSQKLQGDIGQELFDDFCGKFYFRYDGVDYRLEGDDDDPYTLILVHPDGTKFDIELEVHVRQLVAS